MTQNHQTNPLPSDWKVAFQAADIRGVFPDNINEVLGFKIMYAFVSVMDIKTVAIGYDMRISSPALKAACIAGARAAGASVWELGLVTTPMLYFVSGSEQVHGVMITASHNPANYNGLKLVLPGAIPLTNTTGLRAIKKYIATEQPCVPVSTLGSVTKRSILKAYEQYVKEKVTKPKRKLSIVVDVGNGMGALLLPLLRQYAHVTVLFPELDGTFPNRASNPTLKKNQRPITALLKVGGFDLGIAFDGDADRVAFFDERGQYINAAHVGAFLAENFLQQQPKSTFIYTTLNSRIYQETIQNNGGHAVRAKVGHNYIKEEMRRSDAYFGCENSAHYYFKDNFYADSGILAALYTVAAIVEKTSSGTPASSVFAPYGVYHQTEEVLVLLPFQDTVLRAFAEFAPTIGVTKITRFDGLVLEASDWWGSIKKSVTEEGLKFVVESKRKVRAIEIQKEISAFLVQYNNSCK